MYQSLTIVGNVGRDPEMRYTPNGQAVTSFSVATSRRYTSNNGEQVNETIWFRITTWGKQAETCNQYLKKGTKVLIEGRLTADPASGGPRVWTPKEGGQPRASFEVSANTVRFLSSRSDGEGEFPESGRQDRDSGGFVGAPTDDDDIPF
jgi:single-strand DNA-binding protein